MFSRQWLRIAVHWRRFTDVQQFSAPYSQYYADSSLPAADLCDTAWHHLPESTNKIPRKNLCLFIFRAQ